MNALMSEKEDCFGGQLRLAFVVPRYGDTLVGGAETFARHLAEQLVAHGLARVTVLTTCVNDLGTWRNELPPGKSYLNGVEVLRFPVAHLYRNPTRSSQLQRRLVQSGVLRVTEQFEWVDYLHHSPELYWHLQQNRHVYRLAFFIPYLYGTSYYGSMVNPSQSILWPCLHDEPMAYLAPTRRMLQACRGVLFNCPPEQELAQRLGIRPPRPYVVGGGFDDRRGDAARFRERQQFFDPFVLYAGRWELAKGVGELATFFVEYKKRRPGPLKLVVMGNCDASTVAHPDIIPIGFQPEAEKLDVYAAADALIQPSLMESFSIVLMEAWLAGAPVIVPRHCSVTSYHVQQSRGGLVYHEFEEFMTVLDKLSGDAAARQSMGQSGRAYVLREYNWGTVLERFRRALETWLSPS